MYQPSEGSPEPDDDYRNYKNDNQDYDRDGETECTYFSSVYMIYAQNVIVFSAYNEGKGVRYTTTLLAILPPKNGKKHRANAAKPKLTGKAFHASEDSDLETFLDGACLSVKGLGNSTTEWTYKIVADDLRTSSFKISWSMRGKTGGLIETVDGYEDMIEQLKGTRGDVKLLLEELVVRKILLVLIYFETNSCLASPSAWCSTFG